MVPNLYTSHKQRPTICHLKKTWACLRSGTASDKRYCLPFADEKPALQLRVKEQILAPTANFSMVWPGKSWTKSFTLCHLSIADPHLPNCLAGNQTLQTAPNRFTSGNSGIKLLSSFIYCQKYTLKYRQVDNQRFTDISKAAKRNTLQPYLFLEWTIACNATHFCQFFRGQSFFSNTLSKLTLIFPSHKTIYIFLNYLPFFMTRCKIPKTITKADPYREEIYYLQALSRTV